MDPRISYIIFFVIFSACSFARADLSSDPFFTTKLGREPDRARNPFWFPAASLVLPGFDQYLEGQYRSGAVYTGLGYAGLSLANSATKTNDEAANDIEGAGDFDTTDDRLKRFIYGLSVYQFSGSMSAYHSFRSAARSHLSAGTGRFEFLRPTIDENSGDLFLAPFEFHFLKRPTTWAPLGLALGLSALIVNSYEGGAGVITPSEGLFLSGISYNAGVGEEALFRGWLYPYLYDGLASDLWANTLQAGVFAALHATPSYQVPWVQFLGGFYFGHLAKSNNWSLREAVFVHTWWDVIVFSAAFLDGNDNTEARINIPLVNATF